MAREQQYPLRFEPEERAAWQVAADKAGLPLAKWIRAACNVVANLPRDSGQDDAGMRFEGTSIVAPTCPHPAKERTSYGICRLCKQKVQP